MTGKIPYNELDKVCWLNSPLGSAHTGRSATCPQIIVFDDTIGSGSSKTYNLGDTYGINEIIGAQLTEQDTSSAVTYNPGFSISGASITVKNPTGKNKKYSLLIIAV